MLAVVLNNGLGKTKEVKLNECKECGMHVVANEFHPYLACLAFKGCHDSEVVRANMAAMKDIGPKIVIAIEALRDIENTPHGVEGHESSHEAAMWMNGRASKALTELA